MTTPSQTVEGLGAKPEDPKRVLDAAESAMESPTTLIPAKTRAARLQEAMDDHAQGLADGYDAGERVDLWDAVVEVPISDVRALLDALKQIKGGSFPGASDLALNGDWWTFTNTLQSIAVSALIGAEP